MSDNNVHIVGKNTLQNELFVSFLTKETGLKVTSSSALHQVPFDDDDSSVRQLVLFDCMGIGEDDLWAKLGAGNDTIPPNSLVALFNTESNTGIEKEAISRGIRGIFGSITSLLIKISD